MAHGVQCSFCMAQGFLQCRATFGPIFWHMWKRVFLGLGGDRSSYNWVGIVAPIGGSLQFVPIPIIDFRVWVFRYVNFGVVSFGITTRGWVISYPSFRVFYLSSGWSALGSVFPKAVVTAVIGGSGACPV